MSWKAGMIISFGGNTPPDGWAICDGAAISRTEFPETFAAIGTIWGVGNGTTTFNLPDFMGRTLIGSGEGAGLTERNIGDKEGVETVTLAISEIPAHSHAERGGNNAAAYYATGSGSSPGFYAPPEYSAANRIKTDSEGGGGTHENMQPSVCVHMIIKLEDEIVGGTSEEITIDTTQWQALIDALTEV